MEISRSEEEPIEEHEPSDDEASCEGSRGEATSELHEVYLTGMTSEQYSHESKDTEDKGAEPPLRCYLCKRPKGARSVYVSHCPDRGKDSVDLSELVFSWEGINLGNGLVIHFVLCDECNVLLNWAEGDQEGTRCSHSLDEAPEIAEAEREET